MAAASFFRLLTNGFTWTGGTGRTSCPGSMIPRPRRWAPARASMATGQFGRGAGKSGTLRRTGFLRSTTDPSAAAPCNRNRFLAGSIPVMPTLSMDASSLPGPIRVDATMAHCDRRAGSVHPVAGPSP